MGVSPTPTLARVLPHQVKRNLLNVSFRIAQYADVISDLRRQIEHLKSKIEKQEEEKKSESGVRDAPGRAEHPTRALWPGPPVLGAGPTLNVHTQALGRPAVGLSAAPASPWGQGESLTVIPSPGKYGVWVVFSAFS